MQQQKEQKVLEEIEDNYRRIRAELPPEVEIVAAAKSRTPAEVTAAIGAGAKIIGENYVQEAEAAADALSPELRPEVAFHMIGHLQRNKVNKALSVFDAVQSIDSLRIARALNKRREEADPLPVLVQVNIAGEKSKYGVPPEQLTDFLRSVSHLKNLNVRGLMTMEPYFENPERARPLFKKMQRLFKEVSEAAHEGIEMEFLSMGMTNSYSVAVEEGANMVRIGTAIFGPRTA